MSAKADRSHERYVGVDGDFLEQDTWADEDRAVECPRCGYAAGAGVIRCPRCGALLLVTCSGSCASCGAARCARRA